MTCPVTAGEQLNQDIFDICEAANTQGVGISAWAEPGFIWISEIARNKTAAPGSGRTWIERLRVLAHHHHLPLQLCCTKWNSALVDYYRSLGFAPLYSEGEEIFLCCSPPEPDTTRIHPHEGYPK